MTFDLQKVADYANFISDEHQPKIEVQSQRTWIATRELVVNSFKKFQKERTPLNYRYFAKTLHNAASYLITNRKPCVKIDEKRQVFIDDYTHFLILDYRKINPNGKLKPPLPTLTPSFMKESGHHAYLRQVEYQNLKNSGKDHATTLNDFFNSKAFNDLNDYLNLVLNEDDRDHSFLGCFSFREERKVNVLNQFITDLKSRHDIQDVKQFLLEFYQGKGMRYSFDQKKTWDKSAFDILNTGQNITTQFFSTFGMQTTTINLIDKLARSIKFDPQITEEINSRDSETPSSERSKRPKRT